MQRILHVVSHLKKNGTETFIMNLFRAINRDEYKFDFLTFSSKKEGFYEEIVQMGGKIHFLPNRKQSFITYHKALDQFFLRYAANYDIVHFHVSSLTSVAPIYYAKKYNIPKRIIHVHSINCTGLHNKILHRINKTRINRLATHFLGCSLKACHWGFSATPAAPKSAVIVNGIDLNKYYPDIDIRNRVRENLGINDNPIILHVGSFNPIKNHKFLIDSFSVVLNSVPNAKLLFAGDGPMLNEIIDYAKKMGLKDNVSFLGRRENIADLMRAADLFALPSLYEGLGIVLIEAQAVGLPVIASTEVPDETKINDSTTYISLTAGPEKWAEIIIKMLRYNLRIVSPGIKKHSIFYTVNQMIKIYSDN